MRMPEDAWVRDGSPPSIAAQRHGGRIAFAASLNSPLWKRRLELYANHSKWKNSPAGLSIRSKVCAPK